MILALSAIATGIGAAYYAVDKDKKRPIQESFVARDFELKMEREIRQQWIVGTALLGAYLLTL